MTDRSSSLLRPRHLVEGDVVRVVAPSSPFDEAEFQAGLAVLESWGFQPRWREDITERRAYLAGSPKRRAAELHEAFEDSDAAAIFAVRGGYGLTTVLPLLDRELVGRNPKIVVGCSDLTVLLSWLVTEVGMTAVHGPMVGALGRDEDPEGAQRLRSLLVTGGKPAELCSRSEDAYGWCIAPGTARGRAVGGSLSMLAALCGTPWQLDTRGCVLFLEDVGERPYRVDRLLTQLDGAGLFDAVRAVVIGDMVNCSDGEELSWRHAVDRVFRSRSFPVLAGLPFGHAAPNFAFPLGVEVEVDVAAGTVRFRGAPFV